MHDDPSGLDTNNFKLYRFGLWGYLDLRIPSKATT